MGGILSHLDHIAQWAFDEGIKEVDKEIVVAVEEDVAEGKITMAYTNGYSEGGRKGCEDCFGTSDNLLNLRAARHEGVGESFVLDICKLVEDDAYGYILHGASLDFALDEDVDGFDKVVDLLESCILEIINKVFAIDILHLHDHLCVGFGDVENLRYSDELELGALSFLLFKCLLVEAFYILRVASTLGNEQLLALAYDVYAAAGMAFNFYFHIF